MSKYQAYSEYKDSEIPWIDSYPAHWSLTRVKFESYVKARVGWHGLKSDDFTDEGPFLITGSDFKGPFINWNNCYHCDENRYEQDPYIQLKNGDLLITKDGTIGKIALVDNLKGQATLNSGVFVVRPLRENYLTRFYFWLLQSTIFTSFVDHTKTGSTIVHLYQDTFVNFKYSSPLMNEQEVIASFLDHETTKIDTLIEKQQQLIKLLKEKRQAVISHAVTKGLNPEAPMKDSGVEWLGEVPEHWEVTKLYHSTNRIGDGLHATPMYQEDTSYFFINGNNLVGGNISTVSAKGVPLSEYKKHFIELNNSTLFLSINGTIGNIALYKSEKIILGKSAAYINCRSSLKREFLHYYLKSDQAKQYYGLEMTGTTIFNLSLNAIRQMKIGLPNVEEQKEIIAFCTIETARLDNLIDKSENAISLIKERRTALISAAVTGKIDVRFFQEKPANTRMEATK